MRPAVDDADEQDQTAAGHGLVGLLWQWRSLLGTAVVLLFFIGGGRLLWQKFSPQISRDADSLLVPEHIDVQGVPDWVPDQLKWQALRNASLDMPLPLDDPGLERRLARAFDMHPWVERVERVETDFTPEAAAEYPVVDGVETSPRGPEGAVWGDPMVAEAASLTSAIGPEWRALGLLECRPIPAATGQGTWWELLGKDDLRIIFGSAPGRSASDEPLAAEKISRLRRLSESLAAGEPLSDTDLTKP
ncbi:MAG: hypothetical protein EBU59_06310 [Planctomycetia bacterium]|nr:hypothetical protein [Planctomycetia bacterium]